MPDGTRPEKFEAELGEAPEKIPRFRKPKQPDIRLMGEPRKIFEPELGEVPEEIPVFEPPEPELEPDLQVTVNELIDRIYVGYQPLTLKTVKDWATEEPEAFLEDMIRFRGRTPETELMLELFGATPEDIDILFAPTPTPEPLKIPEGGYKFTQDVEGIRRQFTINEDYLVKMEDTLVGKYNAETGQIEAWGTQQTVVPVDGIRKLVTIMPDNRAYDENNKFLGTYNSVTQEIDKVSTIDKASEVWDALIFGSRQMWELGENFFLSALPNIVFQDTPAHQRAVYGDEFADRMDSISQSIREKFRSAYAGNKAEFEDWVEKNPEMRGRIDYQESWAKHPELLKDPFYYAYELANIAPFCAAVVLSSITAGALTGGNPLAVITGGASVVYPVETQAVMEALLANGADEQQAAKIATPAGIIIASLESLGRVPLLNAVSPYLSRLFRREAAEELGKLTARELLKRGIKTAAATELAEVITEVLQEATQNAAVKIVNENQSILEGLDVIAAKTSAATLALSLFGGGVSMRRVPPSRTQGFTDLELQQMGFVKEPKSGNWFQPIEVTEEAITPLEAIPEVPAAKPTAQQIWDTMDSEERVAWASQADLESGLRTREWADLTREQQDALLLAREEVAPTLPEAEVAPPVAEVPPPIEEAPAEDKGGAITPLPDEILPVSVEINTPIIKDITAKERVRGSRHVYDKMGIYEIWEGIWEAETNLSEGKATKFKEFDSWRKQVGRNKERWGAVFDAANTGDMKGLTFNEKRVVIKIREWADEWANRKNLPAEKRIENYIPHLFEQEMIDQINETGGITPELSKILSENVQTKITDPFLKERLGAIGFIRDPFLAMKAYESVSQRVFHYEPLLQKIAAIANDPSIPKEAANYLKDFSRRMTNEPNPTDVSFNKILAEAAEHIRGRSGGEWLANQLTSGNPSGWIGYNLTSVLYTLYLGFKFTSAIRNLSQHTLIIGEVGPLSFSEAISKTLTEESKGYLAISLAMRSRKFAYTAGLDESYIGQWDETFRQSALLMFRAADRVNVRHAVLSGCYEAKRILNEANEKLPAERKLSPERIRHYIVKRGDEVAADTQYLYTKMNSMSLAQSGLGRTFSMLTTWTENWIELMGKWLTRRPSRVYLQFEEETGVKVSGANWASSYKAIAMYMVISAMAYWISDETRLKALEYVGITSLRYLAGVVGGEFPALEVPGAVMKLVTGITLKDDRMISEGWNQVKRIFTPGIVRQTMNVASGRKDWLTLFFYLEGQNFKIKQLEEDWKGELEEYPIFETDEEHREWIRTHPEQAGWSQAKIRNEWRETHPETEAKLFITNQLSTLSTEAARNHALRLIKENKLDTELIKGYDKVFPLDTSEELDEFTERIGNLEKLEVGEEAEYFKTSNFASEVNRLVNTVGRTKIEQDGNPFAVEYLQSKDQWENYDALADDARILFRQQFPDVEASMYLFGHNNLKSFKNPKSAEIMLGLMDKYDIPPEGVPAFVEDPAKYDALFTREFKIKQQWFDLNTEYENYSNPESASYVEDEDLRKLKREDLKAANPDWVADMRRLEAIQHDASDAVVESWAERGTVIDEFEAGSSEAMVWLVDNPEVHQWALEQKLLTDDGKDWNVPSLRITAKWRVQDNEYDTLPVEGDARANYLANNEEYRKDRRRREAYNGGFSEVENFVNYHELPVRGYRQEQFLLDNPSFAKEMYRIKDIDPLDPAKIPSPKYDDIYESRQADFDKLFGLADEIENVELREEIRRSMLYDAKGNPTDLFKDSKRLEAYQLFIPEKHIEAYVKMAVEPDKGFRDERYLKDNPDFYKDVWLGIKKNDPVDFATVPHEEYDNIYDRYRKWFDEWDAYKDPDSPLYIQDPDARAEARDKLTLLNPAFAEAMIRRTGYKVLIGQEEHVDNYVTYYQLLTTGKPKDVDVWYEDDWFLMENPEFYKAVSRALDWELRNFEKVPTRDVFRLYQIYRRLDKGKIRENYRAQNPKLDEWMVLTGKVSKTVEEQEALAELSKYERMALELWEQEQAREEAREAGRKTIEEALAEIERKLRRLK